MGTALEANGEAKAALDSYVKSYTDTQPDLIRRTIIEGVYRKVNGNLEGLEKLIGQPTIAQNKETPAVSQPVVNPEAIQPQPTPEPVKTDTPPAETPAPISTPTTVSPETPVVETKTDIPQSAPTETVAKTENTEESCLVLGEENVSVLNRSGGIGLFVGFKDKNDPSVITFENDQPNDIEIVRDPQIGTLTNRAFFLIKSVSSKLGEYLITFKSPCGNKQLKITVR